MDEKEQAEDIDEMVTIQTVFTRGVSIILSVPMASMRGKFICMIQQDILV